MKKAKGKAIGGTMKRTKGYSKGGAASGMTLANLKRKLEEDDVFASKVRKMMSPTKNTSPVKRSKGGAMKGTKGYSKGGATKGTKGYSKGGATKGTKGYSLGGATGMKKTKATSRGGVARGMGAAIKGGRYSRSG